MSLYRTYRPSTFEEVYGNEHIISSLQSIIEKPVKKRPQVILFGGQSGCGKTTLARIYANAIGTCPVTGIKEINSAQFRGIDTVRDLQDKMNLKPLKGQFTVYIIDECHKMTNDAQNGLLKALEDTPKHIVFILCTTEPDRLINAIRTRCVYYEVKPLIDDDMRELLDSTVSSEKVKIDKAVIAKIIEKAYGSARQALTLLEKVLSLKSKEAIELLDSEDSVQAQIIDLCRKLMDRKKPSWKEIADILTGLKEEPEENIRRAVLGYCNSVMLKGDNAKAFVIMDAFKDNFYNTGKAGLTMACYTALFSE